MGGKKREKIGRNLAERRVQKQELPLIINELLFTKIHGGGLHLEKIPPKMTQKPKPKKHLKPITRKMPNPQRDKSKEKQGTRNLPSSRNNYERENTLEQTP